MSVTESKTKTPRKSSRKAVASTVFSPLAAVLAQTVEQPVPLSALVKSPLNIRSVPYSSDSVRDLADSILGIGLLQNLVVHALQEGQYGVAAGGRRLAALRQLAADGSIPADWLVTVQIIPADLAVAASLTENGKRLDMHPAEQIAGFRTMAEEGKTPAQIGDLLGYRPQHVQRMLKLAGLAPAIMEALANDKITTEHCQALALENDPDRQVQVYETACKNSWNGKADPSSIRELITASEISTRSPKFQLIDPDIFSPDDIRVDLFSSEQGGYVNALALDKALVEKLQAIAEGLRAAEGWGWAAGQLNPVTRHGDDSTVYRLLDAPKAVFTDDELQRGNELQQLLDDEEDTDAIAALESEITAIKCAAEARAWTPEQKAAAGVVVSWRYNEITVQYVMRREHNDNDETRTTKPFEKQPQPVDEISLPLLTKMSSERTLAVQAALMQQNKKAVALLAWTLCHTALENSIYYNNPVQIRLDSKHCILTREAPSGEDGVAYTALMAEKARLAALLPQGWERDFSTFFDLDENIMMALLGYCTAVSLNGVQTRECNHTSKSPLDELESALDFNLRSWWQPTQEGFFSHMKKPQIIAALTEAGLTGAASDAEKMKKNEAADYAESLMANNQWAPCWMRSAVAVPADVDIAND